MGPLWRHFGGILGSLWVYSNDSVSLYDHFGIMWNHFGCMRVDFQKTFIFPINLNDFIKHWGSFGVALGSLWCHFWHMKVTFEAFRGHFEVTLSISTSNFMCDACVMHTCTGLVGPKTGKVKKLIVFIAFLKGPRGPEDANRTNRYPRNGVLWHFGVTLSLL